MLIPFNELFSRHGIKPTGVLHLGANTGQEAEAYHRHGIRKVVWVEALPELIPMLSRHVGGYPNDFTAIFEACVSDVDNEEVVFNVASNHSQSSSFLPLGTHSEAHPTVRYVRQLAMRTVRVDTLLKRNRIEIEQGWFLNADLQGAELLALRGMGELLHKFNYAYIEVNEKELYIGCPHVREVDAYLKEFGLVGVETKMTGAGWGDRLYLRG